jgi:hypothetical protein
MAASKSTSASASCDLSHDEFHCADAMTLLQCVLKDIPPPDVTTVALTGGACRARN